MTANTATRHSENGTERYFTRYGCERDPFSDEGMSGLFYAGADRKKIIDEVLHAVRFTRSPLLLLGKQGSGKSVLLRELKQLVASDMDIAIVPVEIMQTEQQIWRHILQAFHQAVSDAQPIVEQLRSWVLSQASRHRHVFLCIDDAHNLETDFLAPLFELIRQADGYFTLLLAGDMQLASELESVAQLNDFTLNKVSIPDFNEIQVHDYAMYRMRAVGFEGNAPFSDIQIRAAQRRSSGNLVYLNELLRDMLIAGSGVSKPFKLAFPLFHLVIAVALSVILAMLLVRDGMNEPAEVSLNEPLSLTSPQRSTPAHQLVAPDLAGQEITDAVEDTILDESGDIKSNSLPVQEPLEASMRLEEVSQDDSGKQTPLAQVNLVSQDNNKMQVVADEQLTPDVDPLLVEENSFDDVQLKSEEMPGNVAASGVMQRLMRWPDTGYALQIFGTHNAQRARSLVEEYFGRADLLFYETMHNGKPWYVVISGPYSGRDAAQKSVGLLPEPIQRLRPWPRNVASIKGDIERYQQLQLRIDDTQ